MPIILDNTPEIRIERHEEIVQRTHSPAVAEILAATRQRARQQHEEVLRERFFQEMEHETLHLKATVRIFVKADMLPEAQRNSFTTSDELMELLRTDAGKELSRRLKQGWDPEKIFTSGTLLLIEFRIPGDSVRHSQNFNFEKSGVVAAVQENDEKSDVDANALFNAMVRFHHHLESFFDSSMLHALFTDYIRFRESFLARETGYSAASVVDFEDARKDYSDAISELFHQGLDVDKALPNAHAFLGLAQEAHTLFGSDLLHLGHIADVLLDKAEHVRGIGTGIGNDTLREFREVTSEIRPDASLDAFSSSEQPIEENAENSQNVDEGAEEP